MTASTLGLNQPSLKDCAKDDSAQTFTGKQPDATPPADWLGEMVQSVLPHLTRVGIDPVYRAQVASKTH